MIEQLAARYVVPSSNIYDLGCSLGAATWLIRNQAPENCVIHAVDNSAAMVSRLREKLAEQDTERSAALRRCPVEVHEADVRGFAMNTASSVVLNLTLQFVPPSER